MILGRRGRGDDDSLSTLKARYDAAPDEAAAVALLERIVQLHPGTAWAWYDLGLRAKWSRDWAHSADLNHRALELGRKGRRENPSAWNLGIAATALGHWSTARRAWTAYGIPLAPAADDEPIVDGFGPAPVRLNPEPRHPGEPELLIDGRTHQSEVVWCERLCPARAVIRSVPMPESGHRFGDVVLHDGDPVGERRLGDEILGVFNEIARLSCSALPTLEVDVTLADGESTEDLGMRFIDRDFGAEDWSESFHVLCRACSEGAYDASHHHEATVREGGQHRLGLGAPLDVATELIDEWVRESPDRSRGPITEVG